MTDLSPAAQAVVTAIEKFDWESGHFTREDIWMLSREVTATALRAAADQVLVAEWKGRIPPNTTHNLGINWSRDALHAIAAELETNA